MRKTIFLTIAATVLSSILQAAPVQKPTPDAKRMQEAIQLFDNDDRVGAFPILLSLEGTQDSRIIARLGACYLSGRGVKQDVKRGFECFSKAQDDPDGIGLNGLGSCYGYGIVVEQDTAKAVDLWEKAWEKGNLYAASNLGNHHMKAGDLKKAKEYLTTALKTNRGHKTIRGIMEFKMFSIATREKDEKTAEHYFEQARSHGYPAYLHAAVLFNSGEEGFPLNPEKAFDLAKKSGDRSLIGEIGFGIGIEKCYGKRKMLLDIWLRHPMLNMRKLTGMRFS